MALCGERRQPRLRAGRAGGVGASWGRGSVDYSLYEAVIYVGGAIRSLGADAQVEELTEGDIERVQQLIEQTGFDHINPQNVKRVASARELYNFNAVAGHAY